ncbi:hypothetical protein KC902_01570 [Candidatus Kaiserbacteria bacterium]|nr:hypothetical protein [Candidatus Kaiserbacteria bacterium]USN88700.1 MAG: hypothetical protein H6780_04410 [Candidatus Nomurabacteria bacterium]
MGSAFRTIIGAIMVPLFFFVALGFMFFFMSKMNINIQPMISMLIAFSPIWLPLALFYITFEMWMWSVGEKFKFENGRTTLRIRPPQEVLKSPEAMESILNQIFSPNGPDNLMQTYLDGKRPLTSSLEIVSIGGEVRFYMNVPTKKIKNALETQLYAQYPGIEVVEEPIDYTAEVVWNQKQWDMMAFHICKKTMARDDDVLPIKTYIDYKLDLQPKEELKFEPMSPLIEHLGNVKPHERIWIQILMTPHVKKSFKTGSLSKSGTWEAAAKKKIDNMLGRDKGAMEETENRPALTYGERETISAIERNVSKYGYNTAIRALYITQAGKFDGDMIGPMLRSFAQYDMIGRASVGPMWRTDFDYNFFQDFTGSRKIALKQRELELYKHRSYYDGDQKNHIDRERVMSTEEIATMYHIPGTSIVTPGLSRVENARREAPSNLPIGTYSL